mmetsp:Transcript_35221/g.80642  ORF Transcript_35221/g.80642 Transcript_35221/m.80642 type:complete len:193 (+) Transcript_35221:107-685(+)
MLCHAACQLSRSRAPAVASRWRGQQKLCIVNRVPFMHPVLAGKRFAGAAGTAMIENSPSGRPLVRCTMKALGLETFSKEELEEAFRGADTDGSGHLSHTEVVQVFQTTVGSGTKNEAEAIASHLMKVLDRDQDDKLTFDEFHDGLTKLAAERDRRVWPIAASMLVTGCSVGAAIPAMPMLVHQLGMSQAEMM